MFDTYVKRALTWVQPEHIIALQTNKEQSFTQVGAVKDVELVLSTNCHISPRYKTAEPYKSFRSQKQKSPTSTSPPATSVPQEPLNGEGEIDFLLKRIMDNAKVELPKPTNETEPIPPTIPPTTVSIQERLEEDRTQPKKLSASSGGSDSDTKRSIPQITFKHVTWGTKVAKQTMKDVTNRTERSMSPPTIPPVLGNRSQSSTDSPRDIHNENPVVSPRATLQRGASFLSRDLPDSYIPVPVPSHIPLRPSQTQTLPTYEDTQINHKSDEYQGYVDEFLYHPGENGEDRYLFEEGKTDVV